MGYWPGLKARARCAAEQFRSKINHARRLLPGAIRGVRAAVLATLILGAGSLPAWTQATGGWTLNIVVNPDLPWPLPAGRELPFDFRIDNNDHVAKDPTTIEFTVPQTMVYLGTEGLENCLPEPDGAVQSEPLVVTCDVPELAVEASVRGTIRLVPMEAGFFVLNSRIEGKIDDPGPEEFAQVTIVEGADLGLELALDRPTVQAGSIAGFTATLTNHGPYKVDTATLRIPVPAGLSADFATMPADCEVYGAEVICEIAGPIPEGTARTLRFETQVTVGNESTITITANIGESRPLDGVAANNHAEIDQEVIRGLDVSLQKSRTPSGMLFVGEEVTFTLTPQYAGWLPGSARITDVVPDHYTVTNVLVGSGSGWNCDFAENVVACDFDAATGTNFAAPITISATAIDATGDAGVTNTASISSQDENADMTGNNSASDGVAHIVPPIIDLVAYKSGPREGLVAVGNTYKYTLRGRNEGSIGFFGEPLTITDYLPAGLTAIAISAPADWICDPIPAGGIPGGLGEDGEAVTVSCTTDKYTAAAPLAPQQWSDPIELEVQVTEAGQFPNRMLVSFPNYRDVDANPDNNETSVNVRAATGQNLADIAVRKSVNQPEVAAGDPLEFTIEIVNHGPATATRVVLDDRLNEIVAAETGGTPTSATPMISWPGKESTDGISCLVTPSSGYSLDLQCTVDQLPVCTAGNDCPVITVPVRPGGEGVKENRAIVFSLDVPDHVPGNNSDDVSYTVTSKTDVTVSKTSVSEIRAGQPLVYTVAASVPRNGLSGADGVRVTDTLPEGLYFVSATVGSGTGGICTTTPDPTEPTGPGNNTVICDLGRIENGSQRTAVITVVPTTGLVGQTVSNLVSVTTDTAETSLENNDTVQDVVILAPVLDLIISKTDAGPQNQPDLYDPVLKGGDAVYTITATNGGPSDAFNIVITDTLPAAGFVFSGIHSLPPDMICDTSEASTTAPGGTVTCTLERLPAGQSATFELALTSIERGQYENKVTLASDETRGNYEGPTGNNSDSERTTVRVKSDVGVTKTVNKPEVDLHEEFTWTLTVTSHPNEADGYEVAEGVTLSDTLPAGMELTQVPEIVSGPAEACTGMPGMREVHCELGDMEPGTQYIVNLHVKITDLEATTNIASVETLSFDQDPANNEASATVTTVRGSSIEGTVWRDFDGNELREAHDTGIFNVEVTVTGIATHDGATISRTVRTDQYGNYIFRDLPPGTYSVSYGNVPNADRYSPGAALAGPRVTGADTDPAAEGVNRIGGIVTLGNSEAKNHDFTLIPVPGIGLAKIAGTPVLHADGYYVVPYTIHVRNLSEEPLQSIEIRDDLIAPNGNFGVLASGPVPGEGEYAVESSIELAGFTSGTVGAYNGSTNKVLVSGASLPANMADGSVQEAEGRITFNLRVNPAKPWIASPLVLTNQAEVDAEGEYSEKPVSDLSHNTTGGLSNPSLNTPTVSNLAPSPSIRIEKTATLEDDQKVPGVGDRVNYRFKLTNTGDTPLFNVSVSDLLEGLEDFPTSEIERLEPGEMEDFEAGYSLSQADLDRGKVENTATTSGIWARINGEPREVTASAEATVVALARPGLELEKAIDPDHTEIGDPTEIGDNIRYVLKVTNTGNTNLRDVVIVDAVDGVIAEAATPFLIGELPPGGSKTVYANYKVQLADIDAGKAVNTAIATGVFGPDEGTPIESEEAYAEVPLVQNPAMEAEKVLAGDLPEEPRAGDEIRWTVTVANTGNVTLKNVTVSEPDFEPVTILTEDDTTLAPGETAVFTVIAAIRQSDIEAARIVNVARVDAEDPNGGTVTEMPGTEADLERVPGIALEKSVDVKDLSAQPLPDEVLTYTFTITNTGNVALSALQLVDGLDGFELNEGDAARLATVTLNPEPEGTEERPVSITVSGTYPLKGGDIDAGELTNEAMVKAEPPSIPGTEVEASDSVTTNFERAPAIELEKSVESTDFSTPPAVGDAITYKFTIRNTGNVSIDDIRIVDEIPGVEVVNANWSGPLGAGMVNEDAFTATYRLTQEDIDRGSVTNVATVIGSSVGGTTKDDVTDSDDETVRIDQIKGLSIVKTHEAELSDPPRPGDTITYHFHVTNTGNVTLTDVVVTDPLEGLDMPVTTIETLTPGPEGVILTATYVVKQADIQAGRIVNQAAVQGEFEDPVTKETETVGPVESEEILVPLEQLPQIALIKEAKSYLSEPAFVDEKIEYTFTVINTGNLELTDIVVEDPLPGISPGQFTLDFLAPGDRHTFSVATYRITEDDIYPMDEDFIGSERVENQATVTASYEDGDGNGPKTTNDLSGPDEFSDEPTIVPIVPPQPGLTIVKTGAWNDANGNTYPEPGETLTYTFTVKNTGNATLYNVMPADDGPEFNGRKGTGTLSAFSPGSVTLEPAGEQVYTATYVLTQEDIDAAAGLGETITNTATASGRLRNDVLYETPQPAEATVSLPAVEPSNVTLTKQAVLRQVRRGDRVPYIIRVENSSSSNAGPVHVIDTMPSGFRYVDESATLDGEPVTPIVNGRQVRFENLQLGAYATREIRLDLLVLSTAGPGTHKNTASVTDQFGNPVAKDAQAVVEILAEPVFDCGEIIGTVFDDHNRNGYQDDGESGLPGVRVATAKGWLITTDSHGRFHVPCAALPDQRIGSNFIMKLDARTLPTGYRLTTENPRVVRLTAGKMTRLNFGASIGRVVRLDLQAGAFVGNGVELQPQWAAGLDQLIGILKQEPSVLRLNYTGGANERDLAGRRLSRVREEINRLWKKNGAAYSLEIETRVEVGQ